MSASPKVRNSPEIVRVGKSNVMSLGEVEFRPRSTAPIATEDMRQIRIKKVGPPLLRKDGGRFNRRVEFAPEELAQMMSGPNAMALRWIQAAGRNDVDGVWPHMTADFRRALVQGWLTKNPEALSDPAANGIDRDSLAGQLALEKPEHSLFAQLARVSLREIRNANGNLDVEQLGMGVRPRPIGPDLELVRLMYLPDLHRDDEGNYSLLSGGSSRAASVLVRRSGPGWAVAGTGSGLLHPGWPPTWEEILSPED